MSSRANVNSPRTCTPSMPQSCLVCCTRSCDESWTHPEDLPNNSILDQQLFVIYVVSKLLEIPLEICANYLSQYGDPSDWIWLCIDCQTAVIEAETIWKDIKRLEVQHKNIQDKIQMRMKLQTTVFYPTLAAEPDAATKDIRHYLGFFDELERDIKIEADDSMMGIEIEPETAYEEQEQLNNSYENGPVAKIEFESVEQVTIMSLKTEAHNENLDLMDTYYDEAGDVEHTEDDTLGNSETVGEEEVGLFGLATLYTSTNSESRPQLTFAEVCKLREELLKAIPKFNKNASEEEKAARQLSKTNAQLRVLCPLYGISEFPCLNSKCSKVFKQLSHYHKHAQLCQQVGMEVQLIKCDTCGLSLSHRLVLVDHILRTHHPKSVMQCDGCQGTFSGVTFFQQHLNNPKTPNSPCLAKALKCTGSKCKIRLPTKEALDVHIQIRHLTAVPHPYRCVHCTFTSNDKSTLNRHIKQQHLNDPGIKCEHCEAKFFDTVRLDNHKRVKHGKKFPCEKCGKKLYNRQGLRNHMKNMHSEESEDSVPKPRRSSTTTNLYPNGHTSKCDMQELPPTSSKKCTGDT